MSKTYTSGSSVNRTVRGRGSVSGRGRSQGNVVRVSEPQEMDQDAVPSRPGVAERTQRREAYTVIVPDEGRRQTIQQNAAEEERRYNEYLQQNRQVFNYVGTVGDGVAEGATHVRQPITQNPSKRMTPERRAALYREEERKRENAQLDKMKEQQRQKAVANTDRNRQREQQLDEDRRAKNDQFLRQIERQSKTSVCSRQAAADNQKTSSSAATAASSGAACASANENSAVDDDEYMDRSLRQLQSVFPNIDRDILKDLLADSNGDIDAVIRALAD